MKNNTPTLIAAFALICVVGFVAGRISSKDQPATTLESPGQIRAHQSMANRFDESSRSTSGRTTRHSAQRRQRPSLLLEEKLEHLDSIMRSEDRLGRARALLSLIDQLGPDDFESVATQLDSNGLSGSNASEYGQLLSAWAKVDPFGALAYAEKSTQGDFAANMILTTWAISDPDAAIRWAKDHHDGDGANSYLVGIIRGLVANDPDRASQILIEMPNSVERGKALDAILPHMVSQGADAARAWISSIGDDSLRKGAMIRSAKQLAAIDPAGTTAWLLDNPSEITQRSLGDVYGVWARDNQIEAIQSLGSLPSSQDRSSALIGVVNSMASSDPQTVVAVMDNFPNDVNDGMVRGLIWRAFDSKPSLAVSQIDRIAGEAERNRTYVQMLRKWSSSDPNAASQWIQINALPQAVLAELY